MNDFGSTLVSALQAEADKTTQAVDTMPAAQRLESRLDAIDRGRRRRTWVTVIAVGATAVVAVAVVLAGRQTLRSAPIEPIQPPSPTIPGGEVVAADPFMPSWHLSLWDIVRQQAAEPAQLTNCVDPRDWNAVDTRWATYADPANPSIRVNEFVLQYADASSAHRAFLDAWHQIKDCPKPANASDDGGKPERYPPGSGALAARYDEGLARQRMWPDTPGNSGQPYSVYDFRVARAGNVLVVVEDNEFLTDQSSLTLMAAVEGALPHYTRGD